MILFDLSLVANLKILACNGEHFVANKTIHLPASRTVFTVSTSPSSPKSRV